MPSVSNMCRNCSHQETFDHRFSQGCGCLRKRFGGLGEVNLARPRLDKNLEGRFAQHGNPAAQALREHPDNGNGVVSIKTEVNEIFCACCGLHIRPRQHDSVGIIDPRQGSCALQCLQSRVCSTDSRVTRAAIGPS